jgi:osmotically inducible protein OsmC
MVAKRRAEVTWENNLIRGKGKILFGTGSLPEVGVTWASRTQQPEGKTSPEELLAAAHASCLAMAISGVLAGNKTPPIKLDVTAECTFDKVGDNWKVTMMELNVKGKVPGISSEEFKELVKTGEKGCPISNAIRNNVEINLSTSLEQ